MFRSAGDRSLNRVEKILLELSTHLRRVLIPRVRLDDRGFKSVYACETKADAQRPISLWIKEKGTMRWIDDEVREGDIFMDIGANIGIYTIAAAHRVGAAGKVYAFEPHKANSLSLMRNLALSGLSERVDVFGCALSDAPGIQRFNYSSFDSASSGSQLGHVHRPGGSTDFVPVQSEMMPAMSVDMLISDCVILPPTLVKIDVDGNELVILRGMRSVLTGSHRPRALQVEINVGEKEPISTFFAECGYRLDASHFTRPGEKKLKSGVPPDRVEHNAIFRPV